MEEFVEGHEGFYDTISIEGRVVHDWATHYYPNVLEAMRTRWISPQFVATNRIDGEPGYDEVKQMGLAVIAALGIGTSATHMEWFAGPKGLYFSEIGCRPPGVRCWDLLKHITGYIHAPFTNPHLVRPKATGICDHAGQVINCPAQRRILFKQAAQ